MQKKSAILIMSIALVSCGQQSAEEDQATQTLEPAAEVTDTQTAPIEKFEYPETNTVDQVDDFHGTEVADPYRWLEEDVRESEQVADWVEAQNEVTFAYLESIEERPVIRERLAELWDYEKYGTPYYKGGRIFYDRNDGLQNQDVLYMQESLDSEPQLVVDPNQWSEDGTVALASAVASPNGKYLAMAIQDGGSDWRTIKVLDIESGEELEDRVEWMKFSPISWAADSSGFYYSRYPEPQEGEEFQSLNHDHEVFFHTVGTSQEEDRLVFETPDHPDWGFAPAVSDDGRYLVITIWKGTDDRYQVAYQDLQQADSEPVMLIEGFDYAYEFIDNVDTRFYFRTTNDAQKGRVVSIDITDPEAGWTEVIPEAESVLTDVGRIGDFLVGDYLKDARSEVIVFDLEGNQVRTVDLPGVGTAGGFYGDAGSSKTFYSYSSFNAPPTIYAYDVASGESTLFKQADVDFDPNDYEVKQTFYESKDGTQIPIFIAHKKGIERNGENPTLLYGYGGFNISLTPSFSITRLAWMEMGGVYAVANIRGGGEYGEEWHKAGTKLQKQNVFDDFIAAGEYLVAENYTNPDKLAVFGGSNGGLLVGAVVNQRPDLFGAAIPAVGVMDMLRFHQFTAGRFWVDDYGSAENPEEFKALYAYSPYHNVQEGAEYPAVMVTTADTDDRVVPGHSFKYAAMLQAKDTGPAPTLIRIETRAGHGAGTPTEKIIDDYADRWAFLVETLGMTLPEGYGE
ncbi:MAG: prolyl oligopeptidase family serine peptidase [Xanthomonadales bacterium]|nr:prolyl oligopeptidase family serine peptidase [Xanthomonadales bacterium]